DSLEQLRSELAGLVSLKLVQSNGTLERRGVEVDHNLYQPREEQTMPPRAAFDDESSAPVSTVSSGPPSAPRPAVAAAPSAGASNADLLGRLAALEKICAELRSENRDLREQVDELRRSLENLRQSLGA